MRYTYFYQGLYEPSVKDYDIFLSGYDESERTLSIFDSVKAKHKYWLVFPQCEYNSKPSGDSFLYSESFKEDEYICDIFDKIDGFCKEAKLCIDCTGILIPHLLYLIMHIRAKDICIFDVLYSSPMKYINEENTIFTSQIQSPRDIVGYECAGASVDGDEYLIMCAGFNEKMISSIAEFKDKVKEKHVLLGFPPLEPDMYQQNVLQLDKSRELIGDQVVTYHKVSAYDPFASAEIIEEIVQKMCANAFIGTINIAPLSTKISAISCALVYMFNPNLPIRILFPPADIVYPNRTIGIGRTRVYTLDFHECELY